MAGFRWFTVVPAALSLLLASVGVAQTLPAATGDVRPVFQVQIFGDAVTDFTTRINGYFELRARLQHGLPAMAVTDDVGEIRRGTRALARAIRVARRGAVQGEFFTAATTAEIQRTLGLVMNATVWAAIMDDNPGTFTHDIDGSYPDGKTRSTMPGIVLASLPQLPDGIEFRFLGRDLILYDGEANTIIDRLPEAVTCRDCGR
jgi:hypothetical protein